MWTLQDAKNRFSAVVDAALAGQPQEVSRRGKPAVVILSAADYAQMRSAASARRGSFVQHLLRFPVTAKPEDRATIAPRDVEF